MAERSLAENVAQVKADFRAIKDAVPYVFNDDTPTSEYGERIFTEISSLQYQADSAWDQGFNNGIEQGRVEGYENGKTDGITEGIEQGKQEVISNSKYIEKTASGKVIRLDDVSEVYHDVVVKADTPTEVRVCGKNLVSDDVYDVNKWDNYEDSKIYYYLNLPEGTYTISANSTGKSNYLYICKSTDNGNTYNNVFNLLYDGKSTGTYTFTVTNNDLYAIWSAMLYLPNVYNIQLEAGSAATEYEPYHEPQTITATPSGTKVASICPNMTFLSDNDITVDYFSSYGMAEKELAMWKALTFNGARNQYQYAFANADYTGFVIPDGMCKPSSTIAYMLYYYQGIEAPKGIDCSGFKGTNQASQGNFTFYNSPKLIKIYDMGIPAGILLNNTYSYCRKLEEIEIIRCNENTTFTSAFISCVGLIKVIFSGTNTSDIDIHWSTKLSRESILSLLQCLNATVSGITITLPTKCIDTATDTLALIQGDTELNTAYTQALANGYTITFA